MFSNDGFTGYVIVSAFNQSLLLDWFVYHQKQDAETAAKEWLESSHYEIREIKRRMRLSR